jgi:hypothetical protein
MAPQCSRACSSWDTLHGGLVFLTYTVFEEVERLEVIPCRRCADIR